MMFGSFNRRLVLYGRSSTLLDSNTQLAFLHFKELFTVRCFSAKIPLESDKHSFTVSYFINSCGLSPERSAKLVSMGIIFDNPKKPDSVIGLLKDHGLTQSQISIFVSRKPGLLLINPVKIILPKIEFLRSIGVSSSDIPKLITSKPDLLHCSLKNYLIPCYNLFKSLICTDGGVVKILKRLSTYGLNNLKKNLRVNLSVLREIGMPERTISLLIISAPNAICSNVDRFSENVKKVIGMGFDPSKHAFTEALRASIQLNPKTLKCKFDAFRWWGLSDEEIWSAFKKHPFCMSISEKTIMNKMDFLVNKMGLQPAYVAICSVVFTYSLEERIVPRCSVVRVLLLKGLIKGEINLNSVIIPSEIRFLDKFVVRYQEQVPELLDILRGKIDLKQLGFGFDEKSGL